MTFFKLNNTEKANKFIQIIKTIKLFNDYISFIFNEEKIYIQGMDNSHICLYEINILKDWFDVYEYKNDKTQNIISCSSSNLNKILNLYKNGDCLELGYDDNQEDNIYIHIISKNEKNLTHNKEFELNCIDIDFETLTPEEIDYDIDLYFTSKEFSSYCSELINFGEEIQFFCYNNLIKLRALQNGLSMTQNINMDLILQFDAIDNYKVYNKFQINFIHYISNLQKAFDKIKISLQYGFPLSIIYKDDDELLKLQFFLAPKIEDDVDNEDLNEYPSEIESIFNSMIE